MEVWDLYNKDGLPTGKTHIRGEELPEDFYHLVVHVWIRNSKGEFLMSQRNGENSRFPCMWECTGGSVLQGEDSRDGAVREVKEELGIELDPKEGYFLFSEVRKVIDGRKYNDILDVWLFEYDGEIPLEKAETDEVAYAVWMNIEQIKRLQEQKCLVKNKDYFFEKVAVLEINVQESIFEKWEDIKRAFKDSVEMTIISYKVWIEPLKLLEVKGKVVRIGCEVSGAEEYIEKKYKKALEAEICRFTGREYELEICGEHEN